MPKVTLDMSIFHTFKNFGAKYPYRKIEEDQNEISTSLDVYSGQCQIKYSGTVPASLVRIRDDRLLAVVQIVSDPLVEQKKHRLDSLVLEAKNIMDLYSHIADPKATPKFGLLEHN